MNVTLAEVFSQTRRLLGDPGGAQPTFSDELVRDGVHEALDAILPWLPKECVAVLTGDGTTSEFPLPDDCYEIEAVWTSNSGLLLNRVTLLPDVFWNNGAGSGLDENNWLGYPYGKISFGMAPALSETVKIFYSGHWVKPTDQNAPLEPPVIALAGIKYYAAAYCICPKLYSAGNLGQYKTKIDSGQPIDNPLIDVMRFLMMRFETEMQKVPPRQRGVKNR